MKRILLVIFIPVVLAACASPHPASPAAPLPQILSVQVSANQIPRYEMIELFLNINAAYKSPFDLRDIEMRAIFIGPDGIEWEVPGFWDAEESWLVRFTPSLTGNWDFSVWIKDANGVSDPIKGRFEVTPSDHHGWLQVGNWVDPSYNPHYLAYHDGTPFFGIGHCNAFDLMSFGVDPEKGFALFNLMADAGENTLVYWPLYSNPFFAKSYDHYSLPDLKVIDLIVADAEKNGIFLIFTIWNHDLLRDENHPWSKNNMGQWGNLNGYRKLVSIGDFFIDKEAWAWQENLYRYIIARWGYSRAIGLWQTVSEIEGTNASYHRNEWHERVNAYFTENDPYRHPTTASMAGDRWWPEGFSTMDVMQMHSYNTDQDPTNTGRLLGEWTQKMWEAEGKPNFIGEFGTPNQRNQPEHLHNGLWASLVSGAALTPMDWNDSGTWGHMTPGMYDQMSFLAHFVSDLPLVMLDSSLLEIITPAKELQGWGIGKGDWAILWVQDISQIGKEIGDVRSAVVTRPKAVVIVVGLPDGLYEIMPYDTWNGVYLSSYEAASKDSLLSITLPNFERDIAIKVGAR
jgi:hypothetical protein